MFTRACHYTLCWVRRIQFTSPHLISLRSILILILILTHCSEFPSTNPEWISLLTHACYMPCPCNANLFDRSNYICWKVQVKSFSLCGFLQRPIISLLGQMFPSAACSLTSKSVYFPSCQSQVSRQVWGQTGSWCVPFISAPPDFLGPF
jgi:hypothetical protein